MFSIASLAVSKVIARINFPAHQCADARCASIKYRVPEIDIARRHIDLGTHSCTIGNSPSHAAEQVKVLLDAAIAERAVFTRFGQRATVEPHLLWGLVVNIGLAGPDQILGPGIELLKVVGGMVEVLPPVKTKPPDIVLNRIDVFLLFLSRIRVIEPQVAASAKLLGNAESQADRLGMPYVEISIWFRRKG